MNRYETDFYNDIGKIAKSLDSIATSLRNRKAEDCEKRFKILEAQYLDEIKDLKKMMNDEGIQLCKLCQEEVATTDGHCDYCYNSLNP